MEFYELERVRTPIKKGFSVHIYTVPAPVRGQIVTMKLKLRATVDSISNPIILFYVQDVGGTPLEKRRIDRTSLTEQALHERLS